MDIESDIVRATQGALAGMEPHPDPDHRIVGPGMIPEPSLRDETGKHSVTRLFEDREERVPFGLQRDPVILGYRAADDLAVCSKQSRVPVAGALHQGGRPLDVGEEKGDGAGGETDCALALGPAGTAFHYANNKRNRWGGAGLTEGGDDRLPVGVQSPIHVIVHQIDPEMIDTHLF